MDSSTVQLVSPFRRKIMCLFDDCFHQLRWVNDPVRVGHHATSNSHNRPKYSNVEKYRAILCDFKVQESVGIDQRKENEDRGESSSDEGHKSIHTLISRRRMTALPYYPDSPRYLCVKVVRKLADICFSQGVAPVDSVLKGMWQLVKLAKFPSRELRVRATTDGRGILMVFLSSRFLSASKLRRVIDVRPCGLLTSKYRKNE